VKWVAPANLHVTLRFLGDLAPEQLQRVRSLVRGVDGSFEAVPTAWTELGAFPSCKRVQVIWLGLADEGDRLRALAREVNGRLLRAGFGRADKPFRAHVTLGRVRRGRRVDWSALAGISEDPARATAIRPTDGLTTPVGAFNIRKAVLFKSTLTSEGPIYTVLETAAARV